MTKLNKFIERCENTPMGLGLWLCTALSIIFVRDGIENIISTQAFAVPDAFHLLHVPVFFLSLLLFLIVILHFSTKTDIQKISKIALLPFSIILLPVAIDFIVTRFTKTTINYSYIIDNLGFNFLRFFDPTYKITELPGSVRFEIGLVTLMSCGYIFLKRKNFITAILGGLSVYILCFFYVSVPAILVEIFKFLAITINVLHLKNFPLPEGVVDENIIVLLELFLASFLAFVWLWRFNPKKFHAVLKNIRLTRSIHYILLCLLGVFLYCLNSPLKDFFALIRIASIFLSIFFAFQFSIIINDIFDMDCDKISNVKRPLITQTLNKDEYLKIGYVSLALSLLFAYWVSEISLMIVLLFIAFYFLYSAPPLRLKRFFPVSSIIIGLQALLAFIAGEFCLQYDYVPKFIHPYLYWLIFISFTLSGNIKDLKDIEGDKQTGIATLPVMLGEKKGRFIIALFVLTSYCLVPCFISFSYPNSGVFTISLLFGLANFVYIRNKNAKEKIIFLNYFIYVFILMLIVR